MRRHPHCPVCSYGGPLTEGPCPLDHDERHPIMHFAVIAGRATAFCHHGHGDLTETLAEMWDLPTTVEEASE